MTRQRTHYARTYRLLCGLLFAGFALCASAQDTQEIGKLIRAGQYGPANAKVEALLAKNPKDATARFLKGVILTEQGKQNEAIAIFQQLTEDYPELPEPYNNLASLFAAKGQYEKAKTALEMAIQTNPSYGTAYENLGDVYAKLASQAYDKAMQLDKANTTAQPKLAAIRGALGPAPKPAAATATPPAAAKPPAAAPATPVAPPAKAEPAKPAASTAAPAVSTVALSAPESSDSAAVMRAVNAWISAWSSRNLDSYFGAYSASFAPDGKSRDEWEAARRASFPAAHSVKVSIEQPEVSMIGPGEAVVTFTQHYRSERAKLNTKKQLRLAKEDGAWHIAQERILR